MKFELDASKYTPNTINYIISQILEFEPEKISGSIIKEVLNDITKNGTKSSITQDEFGVILKMLAYKYREDKKRLAKNIKTIVNKYVRIRSSFKVLGDIENDVLRLETFNILLENLFEHHLTDVSEIYQQAFIYEANQTIQKGNNRRYMYNGNMDINCITTERFMRMDDGEFCALVAGQFNCAAICDLVDVIKTVNVLGELQPVTDITIEDRLRKIADEYDVFSVMNRPKATFCINAIIKQMATDSRIRDPKHRSFKCSEDTLRAILYFLMGGNLERLETTIFEMKIGK